ncbi:MAG: serine/threonine-protein phosphatase, partial [Spirochaetes bacterium]|nr:serine/threonine-protein phosphatase [Spirochaetota bacterium]
HAGSHLDIIIYRNKSKKFEFIKTKGTFIAILSDISRAVEDSTFTLHKDDILVLYTDGIIEARNSESKMLDKTGLIEIIEENVNKSVEEIKNAVIDKTLNWCNYKQRDDITVVVVKMKNIK